MDGRKIVILDGYTENPGDLSWDGIAKFGDLTVYDRTAVEEVYDRIKDAEIVLTNKCPISGEVIRKSDKLKYIGVLATGYNIVDVAAAKEKRIPVTNVPTYGSKSVAQFAMALILEICHHIGHHSNEVNKGRWASNPDWTFWDYPLIELDGKTAGIVGLGKIGFETAKLAKAFGMKVLANDRSPFDEARQTVEYVELDKLYKNSDFIILHCPLFPETRGMINKESIAKMKDGVIIINNSRGQLVVEEDLADALNSGKVYAAGLDVVDTEPILPDNPLLTAKNAIITPHISWAPKESRQRLMDVALDNIAAFLRGEPQNMVNK